MYVVSGDIDRIAKGRELKNDECTSITSGDGVSCLLLQNITADDSGKYDVIVENIHGEDTNFASLAVEGPPDPPSGTPCITTSSDYVTVTWSSSPYDGGKIVNGYAVEYSMVGSDIWTTAVDECHSLSYVVRGLQPGGRYAFRVRALNVHGYSRPSVESDIVQLEEHNESSFFEPRIVSVEPGPEFKARYDVQEELGKGRFGVVHKVIDKQTNQKLAAKFIKCRTSKDRDKVQDEIDIMNLLRHQKLLQLAAAFENPRDMIMVMEYISGGELFERVVADDFTLTEKDCILFMRQICEGVAYMHSQDIVHLDLKPENIMCHTRTSHEIKIIDFGLAQKLDPKEPVRVLFGTPEFIPPEIISYEPIGVESDMWSIGVICYVLLSGLSPFMGDNDSETFANITRADYDFEDDAFNTVSQNARDFIGALLIKRKEERLSAEQCLKHVWLDPETHQETVVLCTDKLKKFIIRRKWQKTGNAIRALGRMATLSASRRNSANSSPNTPRPSISGSSVPRMSSVNEEDSSPSSLIFDTISVDEDNDVPVNKLEVLILSENESFDDTTVEDIYKSNLKTNGSKKSRPISKQSRIYDEESPNLDDINDGITEGSVKLEDIAGATNGEYEQPITDHIVTESEEDENIQLQKTYEKITKRLNELKERNKINTNKMIEVDEASHYESKPDRSEKIQRTDERRLTKESQQKEELRTSKEVKSSNKVVRTRACSERSDSGISDCSTLMTSTSSTPLLGKKFCINEESEEKVYDTSTTLFFKNCKNNLDGRNKENINKNHEICHEGKIEHHEKPNKLRLSEKIDKFTKGRPPPSASSVRKSPIYTYRNVAGTIKKFDSSDTIDKASNNCPQLEANHVNTRPINKIEISPTRTPPIIKTDTIRSPSRVEKIVRKLSNNDLTDGNTLNAAPVTIRHRSPSPSLLRKTQAVIAKEQSNDFYMAKQALRSPQDSKQDQKCNLPKHESRVVAKSTILDKKETPKSESFRKAAAFWNSPKTSH